MPGATQRPPLTDLQERWLADLYEAQLPIVLRLCTRMLRSAEDAADAAHETFLIALAALAPDTAPRAARSWLLTVARNHCLDTLRRRKLHQRALVSLGGNPDRTADLESEVADRAFVNAVLSRLSQRERLALWQSAVERRPVADIAVSLQLNYMAAAQVLHRARRHAATTAARFAVVIGGIRLLHASRRHVVAETTRVDSLMTATRLAALAAAPLILVAVQPSSSSAQAATSQHLAPATVIAAGAAPTGANFQSLRGTPHAASGAAGSQGGDDSGGSPSSGTLPSTATGATKSLLGTVTQTLQQLASPPPTPSPVGSLPTVSVPPVPTPSVPALPLATPSPPPLP